MVSTEMIFSQYKESCELILDDPKIGGEYIKCYVNKPIRNLIHENIDVHSRRLISELPVDVVNVFPSFNIIVKK